MAVKRAGEDYLEKILMLQNQLGYANLGDVATAMGVSKPTASIAIKRLRVDGYVIIEDGGQINLTTSGRVIAVRIYDRHVLITKMLRALGVCQETAAEDACKIEHVISEPTLQSFRNYLAKPKHSLPPVRLRFRPNLNKDNGPADVLC